MPVQPTFPGVYIQAVPSGVRTITGVSTSVAAFVGMVNRGPLGQAARILSFADYEREFGNDTSASEMTDQVRQFFLNGGQQAFIMRIAQGAAFASVTLQNETVAGVLVLTAKDAGTVGDAIGSKLITTPARRNRPSISRRTARFPTVREALSGWRKRCTPN